MILYGYTNESEGDYPEKLSEATLVLTTREIDKMIEFLQFVKQKHGSAPPGKSDTDWCYTHLKDWDETIEGEGDIIIATKC